MRWEEEGGEGRSEVGEEGKEGGRWEEEGKEGVMWKEEGRKEVGGVVRIEVNTVGGLHVHLGRDTFF